MASSIIEKYLVGGAVRDMLMGVDSNDNDYVVVGSTPEEMMSLGFKQVGADFPVFLDEDGVEYALARKEKKVGAGYNGFSTDHSAKVTLKEDLKRRDLTINAIAMDDDGNIFDPYNGEYDLRNQVLRHVSKAFAEDPVRVLRLARFRARYGLWKIHPGTVKLCKQMVKNGELNYLTRERVLKELEKVLTEPYPELFFKTLDMFGALRIVFPQYNTHGKTELGIRMLIGNAKSVKLKYARLMYAFDADKFEEEFNVSVEWRRYRKMYSAQVGDFNSFTDCLYAMDAFRQQDLTMELYGDIFDADDEGNPYWGHVFVKAKKIGFDDLTGWQKENLKGPAIADAIKELRRDSCS